MKKKLFIKCFVLTLISVIIVFVSGIGITYISQKNTISKRLTVETKLACALLDSKDEFSKLELFNNNDECRVTVISLSGDILYDSDTHEQLDNHIDREEIQAAMNDKPITIKRYSETFECYMTYYALKSKLENGDEIIVRLALKSEEANSYIVTAIPFLVISLVISALIALILAGNLSKNVADRMEDISKSLKSVNKGSYIPLKVEIDDNEFYGIFNEINDLNEKTLQQFQNIKNEQEKLNIVLDNISQGIIAITSEMNVVFINNSAIHLFGEIDQGLLHDLIFPIKNEIDKTRNSSYEYSYKDKVLLVEVVTSLAKNLENEIKYIMIVSDITSQALLAKQKEEFFANASHELKTPLTAMLGLSELVLAKVKDEATSKQVERIHKETIRLSDLISDMLKLSRLENTTDANDFISVPVSLSNIVDDVITELNEVIKEKNIEVIIRGNATVNADEKRIYELIQNLCSNAVNYNIDGGKVIIELKQETNKTVVRVEDTGIGIAQEHIPRLCERFYRVDKSRSKKTGGTGLGLAIVKHVCALYGADFVINSEVGVGTVATVIFKNIN